MSIKPLHDNLLVELLPDDVVSKKGILLSTKKESENSVRGRVVALGDGKRVGSAEPVEFAVSVGDTVIFKEYSGTAIEFDDAKFKVISYEDVIAKVC